MPVTGRGVNDSVHLDYSRLPRFGAHCVLNASGYDGVPYLYLLSLLGAFWPHQCDYEASRRTQCRLRHQDPRGSGPSFALILFFAFRISTDVCKKNISSGVNSR